MYPASLHVKIASLGLFVAITSAATRLASRDDSGFVYDKAYRIRIAKNGDYNDIDYSHVLPGLTDSQSPKSSWWFGYQSTKSRFSNIAVAQRNPSPVFYEQEVRVGDGATWQAYTDHEQWFRLSFKAQYLDEFDPDYPGEHDVFVDHDGDLALGAPAPTNPPSLWGQAPGTYLVCQRQFEDHDVLAIRFAYTVLNETQAIPTGCVPVKLESRCAQLEPLVHNQTWNHDNIIEVPCVKDEYSLRKKTIELGPCNGFLHRTRGICK